MILAAFSPSLKEQATLPHAWPATTCPWIVVILRDETADGSSHLATFTLKSGLELLNNINLHDKAVVNLVCSHPEANTWRVRQVVEVLAGTFGRDTVVVMRDQTGSLFCPDSPRLPVDQIAKLVKVCSVENPEPRQAHTDNSFNMIAAIADTMANRMSASAAKAKQRALAANQLGQAKQPKESPNGRS
ncbi:MAG: hypothetical protein QM742_03340 [Aquabacterium sp.]